MSNSDLLLVSHLISIDASLNDTTTTTTSNVYDRKVLSPSSSKLYLVSGINSSTTVTMTTWNDKQSSATSLRRRQQAMVDTVTAYYNYYPRRFYQDIILSNLNQIRVYLQNEPFYKTPLVRGGAKAVKATSAALLQRLQIGMYFALWYALNVIYNS